MGQGMLQELQSSTIQQQQTHRQRQGHRSGKGPARQPGQNQKGQDMGQLVALPRHVDCGGQGQPGNDCQGRPQRQAVVAGSKVVCQGFCSRATAR